MLFFFLFFFWCAQVSGKVYIVLDVDCIRVYMGKDACRNEHISFFFWCAQVSDKVYIVNTANV